MARASHARAVVVLRVRRRRRALALAAVAMAAGAMAVAAHAVVVPSGPSRAPTRMTLRLHDLPAGYRIGDDSGCGLGTEGASDTVASWVIDYRPDACGFEYDRLYRVPGQTDDPPLVESTAVETPSDAAAEAGMTIGRDLVEHLTGDAELAEAATPVPFGSETRLFHTNDALVMGRTHRPASVLIWRFGNVLAVLRTTGYRLEADDRVLARLAPLQQAHIEHPTPYTRAERDDTLVPLEDPRLKLPVYWLGRTFKPGHGLHSARLSDASAMRERGSGPPGEKLELQYTGRLHVGTWTKRSWKLYTGTELGPLVRSWPCTESRRLPLRRGYAVIYAGYRKDFATCPKRPPNVHMAEVHIGGLVLGVNLPFCEICIEGGGAFNSTKGMEAVVRALRPRARRQ